VRRGAARHDATRRDGRLIRAQARSCQHITKRTETRQRRDVRTDDFGSRPVGSECTVCTHARTHSLTHSLAHSLALTRTQACTVLTDGGTSARPRTTFLRTIRTVEPRNFARCAVEVSILFLTRIRRDSP